AVGVNFAFSREGMSAAIKTFDAYLAGINEKTFAALDKMAAELAKAALAASGHGDAQKTSKAETEAAPRAAAELEAKLRAQADAAQIAKDAIEKAALMTKVYAAQVK